MVLHKPLPIEILPHCGRIHPNPLVHGKLWLRDSILQNMIPVFPLSMCPSYHIPPLSLRIDTPLYSWFCRRWFVLIISSNRGWGLASRIWRYPSKPFVFNHRWRCSNTYIGMFSLFIVCVNNLVVFWARWRESDLARIVHLHYFVVFIVHLCVCVRARACVLHCSHVCSCLLGFVCASLWQE